MKSLCHQAFQTAAVRLLILAGFIGTSLQAQEHYFFKRGAASGALGSIDSVDDRNGNGMLNIPLGLPIRIGGNVTLQLQLTYNSKVWDSISGTYAEPITGHLPVSFPSRKSTAGTGWTLSLGRLLPPGPIQNNGINGTGRWMFIDSSGAEHIFYPFLHEGEDIPFTGYSRDGSYLRLKGGADGTSHTIEFPSGVIFSFDGANRLVRIYDHYGFDKNYLAITYEDGGLTQVITDASGRVWRIYYRKSVFPEVWYSSYPETMRTLYLCDAVSMPGYNGSQAVFTFEYEEIDVALGCTYASDEIIAHEIPVLKRILLPDDDPASSQARLRYEMQYYVNQGGDFIYVNCKQGALKHIVLPSGGKIEWDYIREEPIRHCQRPNELFFWNRTNWLARREYFDIDGRSLAKWEYDYWFSYHQPVAGEYVPAQIRCFDEDGLSEFASEQMTVRETTPLKDKVYRVYTIWPMTNPSLQGIGPHDYGLPYLKPMIDIAGDTFFQNYIAENPIEDPLDARRTFSSLTLDCNDQGEACRPYSVRYVQYESENGLPGSLQIDDKWYYRNQRMVSERVVYLNDTANTPATSYRKDYTDFDGLGHFRRLIQNGWPDGLTRESRTEYNPQAGNLVLDEDHRPLPGYHMLGADDPWILETYTFKRLFEQGKGAQKQEFQFDGETGFLLKNRIFTSGDSPGSHDLLLTFERDAHGNVISKKHYGGDHQTLPLGPLATIEPNPDGWEYAQSFTYANGVVLSEMQEAHAAGQSLRTAFEIDPNTGLITRTMAPNGVETWFDYDLIGRPTIVAPEGGLKWEATYTNASAAAGESIEVVRGTQVETTLVKDGFQRTRFQKQLFPGGQISQVEFQYGGNGMRLRDSTPHFLGETPGWTTYEFYDPAGRPTWTTAPDGSISRLEIVSNKLFRIKNYVALYSEADPDRPDQEVTKILHKDFLGRIYRVEEKSQAGTSFFTATDYSYDIAGRLEEVRTDLGITPPQDQVRSFDYDNRGFLLRETHPEKGLNGNGSVTYADYDSMGHPGTRIDGDHRLRMVYDDLGRLTQVWDESRNRLVQEYFFARANQGTDKIKGFLYQARRHNYVDGFATPDVVVTQTYERRATQGRVSRVKTRVNLGISFFQTMDYGPIDNLVSYGYPRKELSLFGPDQTQDLEFQYDQGMLRQVISSSPLFSGPLVRNDSYHANNIPRITTFANGMKNHYELAVGKMARPGRLSTGTDLAAPHWDSGSYAYDSSGHIKRIGADRFWYDEVGRLARSRVGAIEQEFVYDRFGNLLLLEDLGFQVDPLSNRLSGPAYDYDASGNLTRSDGVVYSYDVQDMVTEARDTVAGTHFRYLYGPGNERIALLDVDDGNSLWTLRDGKNQVVREYVRSAGQDWELSRDYLAAGDRAFATIDYVAGETRFHHRDHLDSVRLITDEDGNKISGHTYLPFGEEVTDAGNSDSQRIRFTGQERDSQVQDYMHARYYNPATGRFTSPDPVQGKVASPQSWNRYAYARNNPVAMTDPDGLFPRILFTLFRAGVFSGDSSPKKEDNEQASLEEEKSDETGQPDPVATISDEIFVTAYGPDALANFRGVQDLANHKIAEGNADIPDPNGNPSILMMNREIGKVAPYTDGMRTFVVEFMYTASGGWAGGFVARTVTGTAVGVFFRGSLASEGIAIGPMMETLSYSGSRFVLNVTNYSPAVQRSFNAAMNVNYRIWGKPVLMFPGGGYGTVGEVQSLVRSGVPYLIAP